MKRTPSAPLGTKDRAPPKHVHRKEGKKRGSLDRLRASLLIAKIWAAESPINLESEVVLSK